jgi:hypothetical protein
MAWRIRQRSVFALCWLEMMTDIQLTADTTNYNTEEEYRV